VHQIAGIYVDGVVKASGFSC